MSQIKWTKATRAKLHGFRTAHKHDPKAEDVWRTLCTAHAGSDFIDCDLQVSGAAEPIIEGVSAEMAEKSPPPASVDIDPARELHRAALFFLGASRDDVLYDFFRWADARALTTFWIQHGGLGSFFDIWTHPAAFQRSQYNRSTKVGKRWVDKLTIAITDLTDAPDNPFDLRSLSVISTPLLWGLCWWASNLDDDEFADALAAVRTYREGLPADAWALRIATSFAFRRDPSLADEDLAAYFSMHEEGQHEADLEMLLPSLSSPDKAHELLRFSPRIKPSIYAYDWVEAFGKDAAPLLERAIEGTANRTNDRKLETAAIKLALK